MAAFGSGGQDIRARAFAAEGDKILNKKSMMGSLFGDSKQKYEDAAEQYLKAANCFKVAKMNKEAGDMFLKTAEMHEKSTSNHEAAGAYFEAGKCYKEGNPGEAISALRSATAHYCEMGRFSQAAKLLKEIAEIFEADTNYEGAKEAYTAAAEYFTTENATQTANACILKVAVIMSKFMEPPDYTGAAKLFEDLGRSCSGTKLLALNAKTYYQQAAFCLMAANDTVATRMKLEEFKQADYTFGSSRECNFIEELCQAMESFDSDGFATAAFEYDKISPLDPWKTTLLVTIKRLIEGGSGGGTGDDVDLT